MFGAFGGAGCGPGEWRQEAGGGGRGPRGGWDDAWSWGGSWRPGRGWRRAGRLFEQGDLKLVILRLLDEKPRHGYEIIKALEERAGGLYSPSPGTVYPTLTLLEDLGHARAREEDGGRKVYEITDAGRAYLAEHRSAVDDLFERIADLGAGAVGAAMGELGSGMAAIARAAYHAAARARGDRERLRKVRDIMERAARDIDALGA